MNLNGFEIKAARLFSFSFRFFKFFLPLRVTSALFKAGHGAQTALSFQLDKHTLTSSLGNGALL